MIRFIKNKTIALRNSFYEAWSDEDKRNNIIFWGTMIPLFLLIYIDTSSPPGDLTVTPESIAGTRVAMYLSPGVISVISVLLSILSRLLFSILGTVLFGGFLAAVFVKFGELYHWVKKALEKKNKITLSEAQELYAKNRSVRRFLETKFYKEDLTANTPQETLEEKFKRVWKEDILTRCDHIYFRDANDVPTKTPTPHINVVGKGRSFLFEYNHFSKDKVFWYAESIHHHLLWEVSSDEAILRGLIKSWVESTFGLRVIPYTYGQAWRDLTRGTLALQEAIPLRGIG